MPRSPNSDSAAFQERCGWRAFRRHFGSLAARLVAANFRERIVETDSGAG
jgi:hypothetical protein